MRRLFLLVLFLSACILAFGQETATYSVETEHYRVVSETSKAQAEDVAKLMEACFTLSNGILHFDPARLQGKLRVKIFKDPEGFNGYLQSLLSQTRADFVFVSYSDPTRSELLGFTKEEKSFRASLIHQGTIQFLKAFIANPPVWLREGLATYLEGSTYDPKSGTVAFAPNFLWLDSLKTILKGDGQPAAIPISDLLLLSRETAQAQLDVFYPEAWGLVAFLRGSPVNGYNRMLWDSISALDPKASLEENSRRVSKMAFAWTDPARLEADFRTYTLSVKTPQDLLKDGVDAYAAGDSDAAEKSFTASLQVTPDSNIAYYYLGLISYGRKNYDRAEQMYEKAFELGMSPGIVNYALGVNSFAGGKYTDAAKYLKFSKDAEPASYGEKADALLKRIEATSRN